MLDLKVGMVVKTALGICLPTEADYPMVNLSSPPENDYKPLYLLVKEVERGTVWGYPSTLDGRKIVKNTIEVRMDHILEIVKGGARGMRSESVQFPVKCEKCHRVWRPATTAEDRPDYIWYLKERGWVHLYTFKDETGWVCPECVKKVKG